MTGAFADASEQNMRAASSTGDSFLLVSIPNSTRPALASHFGVPSYLPYVQPALTEEALRDAQTELGVTLPSAYVALLREQNGGLLRGQFPGCPSTKLLGIGSSAPSLTDDRPAWRPKHHTPGRWAPKSAERLIAIDGDAHWDLCLDYRKGGPHAEPSITFIDAELEEEEPIAASFTKYLAGLVDKSTATAARLYGELTIEEVARALARELRAPAPFVDDGASGFLTFRVALRGDHEWAWVSPNRVPAGYRREGKRIITTEQTACRLPDDALCSVIVATTDASLSSVLDALSRCGFALSPG